jgi:multicomponent Na+:H+ antiporter subunit D
MTAAPWPVLAPLLGACAAALLRGRGATLAGLGAATATTAASAWLASAVWSGGSIRYAVGGWGAPLGIDLRIDGLSVAMLLMTALVCTLIAFYATVYFPRAETSARDWAAGESFWPLLLVLWAALNIVSVSGDLFNLYVGLELLTLAAVGLVVLSDEGMALIAALRYLLAAFLGSLAYLLGVALLYGSFHTLDLALLQERITGDVPAFAALALITVGLSLKTALFPLHFWLPRAHATAPGPVSALLSAPVITASFYLLLRIWSTVGVDLLTGSAAQLAGVAGAGAIVWGSVQAIRQKRLKVMIAYSTVAQIGYLILILPLALGPGAEGWRQIAWTGGVYHAISHAFAKAAMFTSAGAIILAVGHDRIVGVRGIAAHLPVSTYAFGLSGMTLIGLPPSGGFVAKWLMLTAAIGSGQWWWAGVILAGGVLTAGYVFVVLGQELSQAESDVPAEFAPVPRLMEYTAMALALVAILLGVQPLIPLELLGIGGPFDTGQGR